MTKKALINTQNIFLNSLRNNNTKVTIFLSNGLKLFGVVKAYDEFTLVLEQADSQTLIYKSNISSIVPKSSSKPITEDARLKLKQATEETSK